MTIPQTRRLPTKDMYLSQFRRLGVCDHGVGRAGAGADLFQAADGCLLIESSCGRKIAGALWGSLS